MDGMEVIAYLFGLCIVSVAVGSLLSPPIGFLVLGGGIMISVAVGAFLRYLKGFIR